MSAIKISSETQRLVIDSNDAISIVRGGPVGPAGPPGQSGQAISYTHTQVAPASSWVINHNLNYKPSVTVEEVGTGHEIMCGIIHHSVNQVELQFNTPRAGTAHLS